MKGNAVTMQFFAPRNYDGSLIKLPAAYQRRVKWLPQIGDIFPNFRVETTHGPIEFWDWAEGSWVFLFSHPAARTPVCSTEIGALANSEADFRALNTKVIGLTGSSIQCQKEWHSEINGIYKSRIWFPTAEDPEGRLAGLFGMQHPKEHQSWSIRKSFIIDPALRIRLIFEYPIFVGRSVEETLRVVEALQLHERTGFATPADWLSGEPIIIPEEATEESVFNEVGMQSVNVLPYLRVALGQSKT